MLVNSIPIRSLKEVGFWGGSYHPESMQDPTWDMSEKDVVLRYIDAGYIESYELGYSWCRLGCCAVAKDLGCVTQTDLTYVWPEGLCHYVEKHAVKPPEEFVQRAMEGLPELLKAQQQGRLTLDCASGGRDKRLIQLPKGTADFLQEWSKLGIMLPVHDDR